MTKHSLTFTAPKRSRITGKCTCGKWTVSQDIHYYYTASQARKRMKGQWQRHQKIAVDASRYKRTKMVLIGTVTSGKGTRTWVYVGNIHGEMPGEWKNEMAEEIRIQSDGAWTYYRPWIVWLKHDPDRAHPARRRGRGSPWEPYALFFRKERAVLSAENRLERMARKTGSSVRVRRRSDIDMKGVPVPLPGIDTLHEKLVDQVLSATNPKAKTEALNQLRDLRTRLQLIVEAINSEEEKLFTLDI